MTKRNQKPERVIQIAIIKWVRAVMPRAVIHHSVNEVNKTGLAAMLQVKAQKMAGMCPGFPDLIILPEAVVGPVFLEVKSPKGSVSETQKEVHGVMRNLGYRVAVVRSVDDTRKFFQEQNIGFNEVVFK